MTVFKTLTGMFGVGFLPIALIAKLPFAMSVVAVMTAVAGVRGSFTIAGITAALVGCGTALAGPLLGWWADAYGQRIVMLTSAIANAAALSLLALALAWDLSTALVFVSGLLIGASAPQVSSMVRTRWLAAIGVELRGHPARQATSQVLSYESMTDELVFVFGPVVVGVAAVITDPITPLVLAAIVTAVGVLAFGLHPSVRYTCGHARVPQEARSSATAPAAAKDVVRLDVLLPVLAMTAIGLFFGSCLASLTSFMSTRGAENATGVFYGIMGVGSAICALAVVLLPERFSFAARWLVFATCALLGTIVLNTVPGMTGVVLALIIMGCGIGPSLVNLYSIASLVALQGRTTTVMAMMSTGVVVGQSASSAITGAVVDHSGHTAGFFLVTGAIVLLTGLGIVHICRLRTAASNR